MCDWVTLLYSGNLTEHSISSDGKYKNHYLKKNEGKIKTFPVKQKLREFVASRTTLPEMLKGVIQDEMKGH